jgi:hypothetical protein
MCFMYRTEVLLLLDTLDTEYMHCAVLTYPPKRADVNDVFGTPQVSFPKPPRLFFRALYHGQGISALRYFTIVVWSLHVLTAEVLRGYTEYSVAIQQYSNTRTRLRMSTLVAPYRTERPSIHCPAGLRAGCMISHPPVGRGVHFRLCCRTRLGRLDGVKCKYHTVSMVPGTSVLAPRSDDLSRLQWRTTSNVFSWPLVAHVPPVSGQALPPAYRTDWYGKETCRTPCTPYRTSLRHGGISSVNSVETEYRNTGIRKSAGGSSKTCLRRARLGAGSHGGLRDNASTEFAP